MRAPSDEDEDDVMLMWWCRQDIGLGPTHKLPKVCVHVGPGEGWFCEQAEPNIGSIFCEQIRIFA